MCGTCLHNFYSKDLLFLKQLIATWVACAGYALYVGLMGLAWQVFQPSRAQLHKASFWFSWCCRHPVVLIPLIGLSPSTPFFFFPFNYQHGCSRDTALIFGKQKKAIATCLTGKIGICGKRIGEIIEALPFHSAEENVRAFLFTYYYSNLQVLCLSRW